MVKKIFGTMDFLGILTIILVVLKLTGFISWSWWFVLSPIWIPTIILSLLIAFIYTVENTVR